MEERPDVDIFWNRVPIESYSTPKINEDVHNLGTSLENVITDTTEKSLRN